MTKVTIKGDHIEIKGHANFDIYGKDIVCSAISSITITTINAILSIDDKAIECKEDNGLIIIDVKKHDKVTKALISNMINLLKELEEQYEKNIQVEEVF